MAEEPESRQEGLDADVLRGKPRLLALLFCDQAYQTVDGKYVLAGTFDQVLFRGQDRYFFNVYVRVGTRTSGTLLLRTAEPDGSEGGSVQTGLTLHEGLPADADPSAEFAVSFYVRSQDVGRHWFYVYFDGELLGAASLWVEEVKKENASPIGSGAMLSTVVSN